MANLLASDPSAAPAKARDWIEILQRYRQPDLKRSVFELFVTLVPFALLWAAAWAALGVGYWLTLLIAIPAAFFLVRVFLIQHDCGHGALFRKKLTNDWVGRVMGVLTLTPYDAWKRSHAIHHATHGSLEDRGTGDIDTLTVREYRALSPWRRFLYRTYRHPLILFGVGPALLFVVQHRLPFSMLKGADWRSWASVIGTNIGLIVLFGAMIWLVGWKPFLAVELPIVIIASSIGVWLFYIQHQFEDTIWDEKQEWNVHEAALHGSSHYDLPGVLPWLTANIGVHHVHHLYSRIPYYRLPQVLRDFPELANVHRITLWESFKCVKLRLWDENQRRLVALADVAVA
ncbi:fatty acid desaturase [uncultured Hyphomicrobium sp.]|uniref:fatty acid desaturase n=1 Tax=uncultured Hyphomicrobium sp. TaxID=194373 RepID=UPI0025DE106A|nr:fatty acid desaturase [uncultured Hyphomicrobium sp.]